MKIVENFTSRAQDFISYVVNLGVINKLYDCFLSVQGPIDESPKMSAFLEQATALLFALCKLCFAVTGRSSSIFDNKRQDPTGLTALLQNTDLVGVLHMLYCILLHSTVPEAQSGSMASLQEPYSPAVVQVALQGLRFLNTFAALLDLTAFQTVLGSEGLSLAFRHIVSSLLWYCSQNSSEELLHEVIICVGYFTVNHPDNQVSKVATENHNKTNGVVVLVFRPLLMDNEAKVDKLFNVKQTLFNMALLLKSQAESVRYTHLYLSPTLPLFAAFGAIWTSLILSYPNTTITPALVLAL
ncbi:S phase cyclin A-associated protein in the endoplasmic reticulum [Bagarius yarrelli]|uniref:S phase cyclin A-associated protein in the endoplasmic reticulum n=1 Tax=Bagarius yarrelli TaxID=175774 RepID=A0A556U478_BAGYA|nr:S phase cyclin A-associated protein in the endoplasmic reticulum [Bagarius yarrelli]